MFEFWEKGLAAAIPKRTAAKREPRNTFCKVIKPVSCSNLLIDVFFYYPNRFWTLKQAELSKRNGAK